MADGLRPTAYSLQTGYGAGSPERQAVSCKPKADVDCRLAEQMRMADGLQPSDWMLARLLGVASCEPKAAPVVHRSRLWPGTLDRLSRAAAV